MKLPNKSTIRLIFLVAFYIFYVVMGAAIFSAVEGPVEKAVAKQLNVVKDKFRRHHSCLTESDLEELLVAVIHANTRGVSALRNVTTESNWSFGQAVFFATSILTTIGYGHVTPLSAGGKCFSVVYAALGIPLTLVLFSALVERLLALTNRMLRALQARLGHVYRTLHIRLIHVGILFSLLVIFVFLLPAAFFASLESDWTYLDAFYYCFISMTTIGLGDYIPGDDYRQPFRPIYKICTAVYLVVGLVCMMLVLANIYDVPEMNLGSHFYMSSDVTAPPPHDVISEQTSLRAGGGEEGAKYGEGEGGEKMREVGARKSKKASKGGLKKAEDQETLVDE